MTDIDTAVQETPTPWYRRLPVQIGAVAILIVSIVVASAVVSRDPKPSQEEKDAAFVQGLVNIRDDVFFETLDEKGFRFADDAGKEQAKAAALEICRRVHTGVFTRLDLIEAMARDSGISETSAAHFVGAAGGSYCADEMRAIPAR